MATMWQKTMFYLGLVDEDQIQAAEEHAAANAIQPQAAVRTVETQPQRQPVVPASSGPEIRPPVQRTRGTVAGRRVEPPDRSRRRMSSNPVHAEAGVLVTSGEGIDRTETSSSGEAYAEVITASKFSDAQQLADFLRGDRPVVLDLRHTEPAMVRRLVDFSSGLTYALDGTMRKIGQGVILVSPGGANLSVQELRRLADMGLYQAGDVS